MELLVIANQPAYRSDNFSRFDQNLSEALLNIANQSEEQMLKVKFAVEEFIRQQTGKLEHVNFYHPFIERMEHNFYLNRSQKATVNEALNEVKKINNYHELNVSFN